MIGALVVQLFLLPLRFYKWALSPLLPPMCRFHPSCSVYAMGALAVHGPVKGAWLAFRRVTRCHPFNPGGLDPVPPMGGKAATELLAQSEPEIASRLNAPPHPMLGLALGAPPEVQPAAPAESDT